MRIFLVIPISLVKALEPPRRQDRQVFQEKFPTNSGVEIVFFIP
jgi:hypothetical protein